MKIEVEQLWDCQKDTKDYGWATKEKEDKEEIIKEGKKGGATCNGAQDEKETWIV